ncbi:proteasome component [Xylariomycetidae sp. FL0641]|nr:proteasome component [Xylariomycetidae sp. FL0641]
MASSNESAELKLVSSIRFKFANLSGDEKKLSDALHSQLTPLLEKAGSQYKAVRDATFQAFISVNHFVKPAGVVLPVAALLEQYKRTPSPMVKQLDLNLIRQGIMRLDQPRRRELLPVALRGISKETNLASAAGFFNIFLRLLLEVKIPSRGSAEDLALREVIGLADPSDARYVADWLGKLFLLRQDLAFAADDELDQKLAASPTGLDRSDIAFLRNNNPNTWRPDTPNSLGLPECKTKAVGFLSSGAFTDDERQIPAICAAGSADSRIATVADDMLKRSSVDLEDRTIVRSLYEAHNRFPAAHRMQVLRVLSKSAAACTLKKQVVEAVKQDFDLTLGENAPVTGLEALRLHKALLSFLAWIARNSSNTADVDQEMGPALVMILKDYILKQGWPTPNPRANQSQYQDEQRLRSTAYETIGTLARGSKLEHKAKDSLLKWLFDSLVSDPSQDIVVYIESALSSMMSLFKPTTDAQNRDLELLLLDYMTLPDRQGIRTAHHVAARFANNCLPYNNVKARWIDVLALSTGSSGRRDVFEEGQRGLDPWWATKLHPDDVLRLPDWADLADLFFDATLRELGENEMAVDQRSHYRLFPNEHLHAFPIAMRYARQMLFLTAAGERDIEIDWQSRLESRLKNDLALRSTLRDYFKATNHASLLKILNAAFDGLRDHLDVGAEECVRLLADILSFAPVETIILPASARAHELLPVVKSNDPKVRQLASKVFGIIGPWNSESTEYIARLESFVKTCDSPSATQSAEYQGSFACMGSFLAGAAYYGKLNKTDTAPLRDLLLSRFFRLTPQGDTDIAAVVLDVMAQLWTARVGYPEQRDELAKAIDVLSHLAKSGREKAITAFGRLAMMCPHTASEGEPDSFANIMEQLFSLSENPNVEVQFATGEAITAAISGWESQSVQLSVDVEPVGSGKSEIVEALGRRPRRIEATLNKLVQDCKHTKPSLLKASGIWLFCIIQYCPDLAEVQSRLRECQVAFMRLLTARDELVQETASRGLALVYEKGDQSLKGDLVKDLVASFTGTKTQLKVDQDTELFDAGALPTGGGKSITSYKDIIGLANEVGDQSLIYKFMALATNAATWTARSAFGRFGLSNILSDADLDPKIYPKLFRYRFDPNSNVRRSMDDIWKAVVKDQTAVIDQHFDAIMTDLLRSILDGREWRVREASCAAIADLIYGQPFPKYEKYYIEIWRLTLKVLDDQKGSVRNAALKLSMGLSKTLVTQLQENNSSSSAKAMTAHVVPFLLSDKGVENSVEEAKFMAITTVLDVVKNGGDALKPFIPTIITHFLGLLSTVEPEAVNYYYQRVSEEDREGLDKLRSTAATRSPIFECITNCLRFIDEQTMKELAPQLVSSIKSALGMQTKVGCSEVLNTLALRHSILLPPYNATFLKAMETQVLDRNHEASRAYARSAAYLLRTASSETRDRFTSRLTNLYFTAEDETRRQKIADAVLAIAKVSPDAFTDLESRLLPFSYFAKHDTDAYVSEEFNEVWNQHAGGSHTIRRYVEEIAGFVLKGIDSSKWALQHGAALTVADMVVGLSSAVGKDGQFSDADLQRIWPILDKSLSLKTFKGKEKIVGAYPLFVRHSKKLWANDPAIASQLKKIAIREAKRNNDEYRPHAFEALAAFAAVREDLEMYSEVVGLVSDYLNPEDEAHKLSELERKTTEAALRASMTAYRRQKMQSAPTDVLDEVLSTVEGGKQAISIGRDTFFVCAADLFREAAASPSAKPSAYTGPLGTRWFKLLTADETGAVLESQRAHRAKALGEFVKAWKAGAFGAPSEQGILLGEMQRKVKEMTETERSLDVQRLLEQVGKGLDS